MLVNTSKIYLDHESKMNILVIALGNMFLENSLQCSHRQ